MKLLKLHIYIYLFSVGFTSSSLALDHSDISALDKEFKSAISNQVDVLSPQNFNEAKSYLEKVKVNSDKLKIVDKALGLQIKLTRDYLRSANQTAMLSHRHLDNVINARRDAVTAGAPVVLREEFISADSQFQKITADLEAKNIESAIKNRDSLQGTYSNLELRAIKNQHLAVARKNILQAIKEGARTLAPEQFRDSLRSYKTTSDYISANRHNAQQIQPRALLVSENANRLLATTQSIAETRRLASGAIAATDNYLDEVNIQQSSVANRERSLNQVAQQIRDNFTNDEAEIKSLGETIVISLKSFHFPEKLAALDNSNLLVLGKIQRLIREAGIKEVVIEDHSLNKKLRAQRAQTIKDYLLSTDALPASQIKVAGQSALTPNILLKTSL